MLANSVSPPKGGTSRAISLVAIGGRSRHAVAERLSAPSSCPRSMPRISAPSAPATGRISSAFEAMSGEHDRQLARTAHRALRPGHPGAGREAEFGNALEPFLQRDGDLHARQIRPDAAAEAEAERGG